MPFSWYKTTLHKKSFKQTKGANNSPKPMASASTSSLSLQNNGRKVSFPVFKTTTFHKNLKFSLSLRSKVVIKSLKSSSTTKFNEVVGDEEMDKIRRLQNGSDVRGVALEGENVSIYTIYTIYRA